MKNKSKTMAYLQIQFTGTRSNNIFWFIFICLTQKYLHSLELKWFFLISLLMFLFIRFFYGETYLIGCRNICMIFIFMCVIIFYSSLKFKIWLIFFPFAVMNQSNKGWDFWQLFLETSDTCLTCNFQFSLRWESERCIFCIKH